MTKETVIFNILGDADQAAQSCLLSHYIGVMTDIGRCRH